MQRKLVACLDEEWFHSLDEDAGGSSEGWVSTVKTAQNENLKEQVR